MKNYISVDDKYFRVTLVDGKPVCEEVKPEEAVAYEVEAVMIGEDAGIDRSMFQDIIDVTQQDMKENIEKSLKDLILGMMGFNDHGGGNYRVRGFNDDRSPVAAAIAAKLTKRLEEVDLSKELDLTPKEKSRMRASMKKQFTESYLRYTQQYAWREGEKLAKQHCESVVKKFMDNKMKDVAQAMLEQAIRERSRHIATIKEDKE